MHGCATKDEARTPIPASWLGNSTTPEWCVWNEVKKEEHYFRSSDSNQISNRCVTPTHHGYAGPGRAAGERQGLYFPEVTFQGGRTSQSTIKKCTKSAGCDEYLAKIQGEHRTTGNNEMPEHCLLKRSTLWEQLLTENTLDTLKPPEVIHCHTLCGVAVEGSAWWGSKLPGTQYWNQNLNW